MHENIQIPCQIWSFLRCPGSRNGDFHQIPPLWVENELFTPEFTFSTFLPISTPFGENHSLGSRGHLKSIHLAQLFLVQITASRTAPRKVLKSPATRPRAPTCIRVRDLGRLFEISRIQFRCSMSSPFALARPSGGRKHKKMISVFSASEWYQKILPRADLHTCTGSR